ncbi:MAG: hypothetical protein ACFFAO_11605, partial [Candidatus Hermodarchaeota archaeon]
MSKDIKNIDEIKVLKDMILSQRQELDQKENEIKKLDETNQNLISELKFYKKLEKEFKDTSILEDAH